jgi:hypothetical protein
MVSAPPEPAPFYEFVTSGGEANERRVAYVPSAAALWHASRGGGGTWARLRPEEAAALDRLTRGLQPYQRPTVSRATVGGRTVRDPSSYLSLYGASSRDVAISGRPVRVILYSGRPTPWTGLNLTIDYYPRGHVIVTAGTSWVIGSIMGRRLLDAASLAGG